MAESQKLINWLNDTLHGLYQSMDQYEEMFGYDPRVPVVRKIMDMICELKMMKDQLDPLWPYDF